MMCNPTMHANSRLQCVTLAMIDDYDNSAKKKGCGRLEACNTWYNTSSASFPEGRLGYPFAKKATDVRRRKRRIPRT